MQGAGTQPANFLKYTGEYLDPTGIYHLRARQYDPTWSRFMRPDPVDSERSAPYVAAYVYAMNQPTVLVDPSGRTFTPANDGRTLPYFASSPAADLRHIEPPVDVSSATERRIAFAFQYFMNKGLRDFKSAGLVGNFLWETKGNLSPRTKELYGGPGRGIAQWTVGQSRWNGLLALARREGVSPWNLKLQVQYVWQELTTTFQLALRKLRRTRDVVSAATIVMDEYEISERTHLPDRIRWAKYVLANYG